MKVTQNIENIYKSIDLENILQKLNISENDIVFLSGSLIEGIGNKKSDLDIFVIYSELKNNNDFEYDFGELKTEFKRISNYSCDIEYWPESVLKEVISKINIIDFSENNRTLNLLKVEGYNFIQLSSLIHRFIIGKPIFNNNEFFRLNDSLNIENYYTLMSRFYINTADNSYNDVLGTLQNEDYLTSLHISKTMLLKALMALIFAHSDSIDREKWIFKKLEILSESSKEINDIYLKAVEYYFNKSNNIEEDVEKNLDFINEIINYISELKGGL